MVFSGPCVFLEALREAAWAGSNLELGNRATTWGYSWTRLGVSRHFLTFVAVECQLTEVLSMFVRVANPNCTKYSLELVAEHSKAPRAARTLLFLSL